MSTTSQNSASSRISALLDDNSFVEIGGSVTARNTDFNMQNKETPADGVLTGYGTIDGTPCLCLQPGCNCSGRFHRRNARKEDCKALRAWQ